MRIVPVLSLLLLLSASPSRAEMIYTAPTDIVATHAELVVRARVDLTSRRVQVLETYRGDVQGTLEVRNLRDFAATETLPGARSPTDEALLFLDEVDGRYYLVHTSSPAWILPHASVLYLTPDGEVLAYGQFISGVLQLSVKEDLSAKGLQEDLAGWLSRPRVSRWDRPSLDADEATRLYALTDPFLDMHLREVIQEPHRQQLVRMLEGLEELVLEEQGELRRRALEALLLLGQQRGTEQVRRGLAEAKLLEVLERIGPEDFLEPCLDEVGSPAVSSSRRTAAMLLRRVGGAPREKAKALLLDILTQDQGTLATEAYFALRELGYAADAEEALRTRGEGSK